MNPQDVGRSVGGAIAGVHSGASTRWPAGLPSHPTMTWSLNFGPPLGWQSFDLADPAPGQHEAAAVAIREARHELPGLIGIPIEPAFFSGPSKLGGYFSPRDGGRVWIRAGLTLAETSAVARHEVGHAGSHRAFNDVGDELLPEAFAVGRPGAAAALAYAFSPAVRATIAQAAVRAARTRRSAP